MMNDIFLRGILTDIKHSHTSKNIDYDKARLIVTNTNGDQSSIDLIFKHFQNHYDDGDEVTLCGNIRTLTKRQKGGKNRIFVYVYTYFDTVSEETLQESALSGRDDYFNLEGVICKLGELRTFSSGRCNIQFTVGNTLDKGNGQLNNYIPCIAWGKWAKTVSKLNIGDKVLVVGELKSHEYKKYLGKNELEIRVAHEAVIEDLYTEEEMKEVL